MDKKIDSQVKCGTRNQCYHVGMIPLYFVLFSRINPKVRWQNSGIPVMRTIFLGHGKIEFGGNPKNLGKTLNILYQISTLKE